MHSLAADIVWWQLLLAPTLGGLLIGLFLHFVMPGHSPLGVAQVIEAGALKDGRMPFGQGLAAAAVSAASLGVGASAGREGPMVHLGATLAAQVARMLRLNPSLSLTLLGCGVAAGVAASFNAPLAGMFFALEVVVGHYALQAFAPIVIASVAGTIISRAHYGAFPAFIVPDHTLVSVLEFPGLIVLGAICAGVARALMRGIILVDDGLERVPLPLWARPMCGGLVVGAIALQLPHVLGVGYEATDDALQGLFPLWLLLVLIVAKLVATAVSLGCRFGGGVFSPALFLGAMTGGAFGLVSADMFSDLSLSPTIYAMVGMAAVAAPVLGAPVSTVLIVFELTGDYTVAVAAMAAVAPASVISHQFLGTSFFGWQLRRQGLDLRGGRAVNLLRRAAVRQHMSDDFIVISETTPLSRIRELLGTSGESLFIVCDDDDRLVGTLSLGDLRDIVFDRGADDATPAAAIARRDVSVLTVGDSLESALERLDASMTECLPVIRDVDSRRIAGALRHKDVLLAYNRALMAQHRAEHDDR